MGAISWLAKEQSASQLGLRSVDLLSIGTIKVDTDHVNVKVKVNNALSTSGKAYRGVEI